MWIEIAVPFDKERPPGLSKSSEMSSKSVLSIGKLNAVLSQMLGSSSR